MHSSEFFDRPALVVARDLIGVGLHVDGVGGVISQLQSSTVNGNQPFTLMDISDAVAPAGAVEASLRGIVQMQSLPMSGDSDFHIFDNFTLTAQAVPEPATLTLLALGAAGLVLRRRSR